MQDKVNEVLNEKSGINRLESLNTPQKGSFVFDSMNRVNDTISFSKHMRKKSIDNPMVFADLRFKKKKVEAICLPHSSVEKLHEGLDAVIKAVDEKLLKTNDSSTREMLEMRFNQLNRWKTKIEQAACSMVISDYDIVESLIDDGESLIALKEENYELFDNKENYLALENSISILDDFSNVLSA